jgi:hypothetical protein
MKKISKAAIAVLGAGAATLGVLTSTSADAATPAPVAGNTVAVPLTRVVNVPGLTLANGQTRTISVAGRTFGSVTVPANATAIEGLLTVYMDSGTSRLSIETTGTGAPGTPTVIGSRTSVNQPSGAGEAFHVALSSSGGVDVHNVGAATHFLLAITGYDVPAAAPAQPGAGNILHNSHTTTVPAGSNGAVSFASCAAGPNGDAPNGAAKGYVAIGGGFNIPSRDPGVYVSQSKNDPEPTDPASWQVVVNNTTATSQPVQVWVVCISAPTDDPTD